MSANTSEQAQTITAQPQLFGTSTAPIFERPNEIYGIFQILQNLEFEQVPEASLTTPLASSNTRDTQRSIRQNRDVSARSVTNSMRSSSNSTQNVENTGAISLLEKENNSLRKENEVLNRELQQVQQNKTNSPQMSAVINNLVTQFSEQRTIQEQEKRDVLASQVSILKRTIAEQTKEIQALTTLPSNEDDKFTEPTKRLTQEKERLENENKTLMLKMQDALKGADNNLAQKEARINELEQDIAKLNELYNRDVEVANKLSQQLAANEKPLAKELEALNTELSITRKALEQEQYRSQQLTAQLSTLNNKFNQQLEQIQQQQSASTVNQSQELLSLRQRVQQSEIINQKLQQELIIVENDVIQKESVISQLRAEKDQISQQYGLQLNELQQNLANARRAEAEANRWARTAGGGNPSVSSARLATLQQEVESLRQSEEMQRAFTTQKQQEVISLQNQLAQLQALFDSEQKSKKLLEDQVSQQQEKETEKKVEQVTQTNKKSVPVTNSTDTKKATTALSTSSGMQGIAQ